MNERVRILALGVGGFAIALLFFALIKGVDEAASAYLFAWFFWLGLPLGALTIFLLHRLTGGRWGVALEPVLTAAMATLPWMAILGLPLLFVVDQLYPWLDPRSANPAPWYLNRPFFFARLALYFIAWLAMIRLLPRAGRGLAAGATIAHGLLITFAAIDLIMSLTPQWFSTVFGLMAATAQILSALAFSALSLRWFMPGGTVQDHHDIGNLLLAFVMIWAYLAFTQFLVIWYENKPAEVSWYLARMSGGWGALGLTLLLFHFVVPFLLLLIRQAKRDLSRLAPIGAGLLLARMGDGYWFVVPSLREIPSLWDPAALVGIGGLWLGAFLFHLAHTAKSEIVHASAG